MSFLKRITIMNRGATALFAFALLNTPLFGDSFVYSASGLQSYTATTSGVYQIIVNGASGGNSDYATGGHGASIDLNLNLTAGNTLFIYAGQMGIDDHSGGGGGGSFVFLNGTVSVLDLVAAAGGGGGAAEDPNDVAMANGGNALLGTAGGTPGAGAAGGTAQNGGGGVAALFGPGTGGGAGGGGLSSKGGDGDQLKSGGDGVFGSGPVLTGGGPNGGYGGGGASGGDIGAGGGGGGCSGGGGGGVDRSGNVYGGGGGGSCWQGQLISASVLTTSGDGSVEIIAPANAVAPEPGGFALFGFGLIAAGAAKKLKFIFR